MHDKDIEIIIDSHTNGMEFSLYTERLNQLECSNGGLFIEHEIFDNKLFEIEPFKNTSNSLLSEEDRVQEKLNSIMLGNSYCSAFHEGY